MFPGYEIDPALDSPQFKGMVDSVLVALQPRIELITPNSAGVEDKGFEMKVHGKDFVDGSVVQFNGKDRATTVDSSTGLTAKILSADLLKEGEYEVRVISPIKRVKASNTVIFKVESSGAPWTWIGIGAGAVAAGVVAIIATGGKNGPNGEELIADPPDRP
jgi:hypothetical protein